MSRKSWHFGDGQLLKRRSTMRQMLLGIGIAAVLGIGGVQAAGDVAAGKAKAAACTGCHGANGEGIAANPALAGKGEEALAQALKDYKSGKRDNAVMKGMVAALSDGDIANLAGYYASLKAK
jgi:cytochrome c553